MEQDNKMTPGNLGIVFGPTLLRPRPTEATVSLSSLVDYPHQARIVETLITHYSLVFQVEPEEVAGDLVRLWMDPRAVPLGAGEGPRLHYWGWNLPAVGCREGGGRCLVSPPLSEAAS